MRPDALAIYRGPEQDWLRVLSKDLLKFLREAQRSFSYDTLRLWKGQMADLADILVEFAEDVHNNIGIWRAYEHYNVEYFGVPLPFAAAGEERKGIHLDRVRHLLWVLYPELISGLILSPAHKDLEIMAEAAQAFLAAAFRGAPKGSAVKALLQTTNHRGWDVKHKLIWLGTESYLFRLMFQKYLDEHNRGQWEVGCVDDFVCQVCTHWSGLGAIDILAGVLDISADDRRDLRSWYERHTSFYRMQAVNDQYLDALNVISDRLYRIRTDQPGHPFRPGQMVFGSLVPWRGEWYWSGQQQKWDDGATMDVNDLRDSMKRKSSQIACRFWPEYEAQVRERAQIMHQAGLACHGKDLVVFPDGLAMAADWQREMQRDWDSRPPEEIQEVIKKHGLTQGRPNMNIPPDMLNHTGGIGVFLHPVEGQEIMCGFHALIEGLQRRGGGLTSAHQDAIQQFISMDGISPEFVKRVLDEYGADSVKTVFRLPENPPSYWLDYLLRRHKGSSYRKRYPALSLV